MSKVSLADILELDRSERIRLVEDIWESIAAIPSPLPLTFAQRSELDRRLENYHRNPENGTPWEALKREILGAK